MLLLCYPLICPFEGAQQFVAMKDSMFPGRELQLANRSAVSPPSFLPKRGQTRWGPRRFFQQLAAPDGRRDEHHFHLSCSASDWGAHRPQTQQPPQRNRLSSPQWQPISSSPCVFPLLHPGQTTHREKTLFILNKNYNLKIECISHAHVPENRTHGRFAKALIVCTFARC